MKIKTILPCLLLLFVLVLSSCDIERIIIYQTVSQTQTQTVTSVRTITLQPTVTPTVTVTVTGITPSNTEAIFFPITFTGSSDKTTSPFTVTTSEWIIDWSYVPDPANPEFAMFGFFIYPRGDTVSYVESILFPSSTSGTTYSYAGVGEYYINVLCTSVNSWSITVRPA